MDRYVDPRGPRFGAWLTVAALAAVLLTGSAWLAAAQTAVFLTGAAFGLAYSPYGRVFRLVARLVRLGPPVELEAEAPPRFAQVVGAGFGVAGTVAYAAGAVAVAQGAIALALAAAFLNAAFGFCLGCEVYLLACRVLGRAVPRRFVPVPTPQSKGATA